MMLKSFFRGLLNEVCLRRVLNSNHVIPRRCAIEIKQPMVVLATGRTISGGINSQERVLPVIDIKAPSRAPWELPLELGSWRPFSGVYR
jgi:hypothetical protein